MKALTLSLLLIASGWPTPLPMPFSAKPVSAQVVEQPPSFLPPPTHWTIAAVGDVLLHQPLHQQALRDPNGHRSLWLPIEPLIQKADIAYANLEGPTAPGIAVGGREVQDPGPVFDKRVYTSYPMFNYQVSLLSDLAHSGFDVVSSANNHSLDRGARGADLTIDHLRANSLAFTGTRRSDEPQAPWFAIVDRPGLRTAWIACSFSTNGLPDRHRQVLDCYRDEAELLEQVRQLAARSDIDAIIATPHFGNEYQIQASPEQKRLARALVDAGALAVLGAHPHVPQGWERHVSPTGHSGFILYSLGNFVSGQFHRVPTRATLLLELTLKRTPDGQVVIGEVSHVPLEMTRDNGWYRVQPITDEWGTPAIRKLLDTLYSTPPV